MTAHAERWSKAEIAELARFILKRHKADAVAFAEARASMFRSSAETDDALRWTNVAERIRLLVDGNVVPLRLVPAAQAGKTVRTKRPADTGAAAVAAAPPGAASPAAHRAAECAPTPTAEPALTAPGAVETGGTRLVELLNTAEATLAHVLQRIARQEQAVLSAERDGRDTRAAFRALSNLLNGEAIWRDTAERLRRAIVAHTESAALIRRSEAALAESRALLGA